MAALATIVVVDTVQSGFPAIRSGELPLWGLKACFPSTQALIRSIGYCSHCKALAIASVGRVLCHACSLHLPILLQPGCFILCSLWPTGQKRRQAIVGFDSIESCMQEGGDLPEAFAVLGFAFYVQPMLMPLLHELPPGPASVSLTGTAVRIVVIGVASLVSLPPLPGCRHAERHHSPSQLNVPAMMPVVRHST